jgi:hypothetical protein
MTIRKGAILDPGDYAWLQDFHSIGLVLATHDIRDRVISHPTSIIEHRMTEDGELAQRKTRAMSNDICKASQEKRRGQHPLMNLEAEVDRVTDSPICHDSRTPVEQASPPANTPVNLDKAAVRGRSNSTGLLDEDSHVDELLRLVL